jgi:hypothetical protein
MPGFRRAALAYAAVLYATFVARPALAADPEPWPPPTAPGANETGEGNGSRPAPTPPAPYDSPVAPAPVPSGEVSPLPHAVAPPDAPEAASPTAPAEVEARTSVAPAASSAPDAGVVVTSPGPQRRSGLQMGSRDGQFFLRTPGDGLVLLPAARLEIDGSSLTTPDPYTTGQLLSVDRLRFDLVGWLGSKVYFDLSADVAYAFSLRHTDNFVAVAPWGDRAILQVGQFDAPFTMENRTPDRYLDLYDRGVAVRAFAIPHNKDQGIMLHGTNPARNFYYSAALLNGEGPTVNGFSGQVDVMARAWIAPFSFGGPGVLRDVTVGGSAWTGDRSGQAFENQTTPGAYIFVTPSIWWMSGRMDTPALRQQGRLEAGALEVNAPIGHRLGVRFEGIAKRQPLAAFDTVHTMPSGFVGSTTLSGWAGYAEIWGWVFGSDRLLGPVAAPGQQLPLRYSDLGDARARGGLMLTARIDHISESLTDMVRGVGVGSGGQTRLTAYTAGGSYWFTRRARLIVNYTLNRFDGSTPWLNGLGGKKEQEVLGRLALAL